jgi:hypothetical protein
MLFVTDLSERDFRNGLGYIAVSRVETLQGLMLDALFDVAFSTMMIPSPVYLCSHSLGAAPLLTLNRYEVKIRDRERRKQQELTQPPYAPSYL